ncbi:hypothetical protein DEO72_LG10g3556 [Vigna unguiculata]|uniref:Uncharacterized protein n=1 Tax=Vigna unguiculata TaxID=3917 RepID=A0A4D6NI38_VIGUN|nr:hypothetical protein DEO72_LG10g3556 [Vigna unguiculata]
MVMDFRMGFRFSILGFRFSIQKPLLGDSGRLITESEWLLLPRERRLEVGEWFMPIGLLSALNDYGANPGGNEESGNALLKEMEDAFGFAEGL